MTLAKSSCVSTGGGEVPLAAITHYEQITTPLVVNHQGQFPVTTLSFDLAPGASLGDAVDGGQQRPAGTRRAAEHPGRFPGHRQGLPNLAGQRADPDPGRRVTVYIVLGVLYESYIHPITILSTLPSAAVGALLALMLCNQELSVIGLIGIVLLIGIVEKNAIMMIDFALEKERKEGEEPLEAIFQACLLRFRPIIMTTMAALLGGVPLALGSGDRPGTAAAVGHRDCRRPDFQPVADALHHAGDLPGLRQPGQEVHARATAR